MADSNNGRTEHPDEPASDLEQAQTTAADVESAGRSCVIIIALVVVILGLLGVWVFYTAT